LVTIEAGVMRVPDGTFRGSVSPVHSTFTFVPPMSTTSVLDAFGCAFCAGARGARRVAARFDLLPALRLAAPLVALRFVVFRAAIVTSRRVSARRMPA
jgi:hypothetical protein